MKARGLFINRNTNEIVSRSYNKFFNIEERLTTKMHVLVNTLRFPVTVYDKANGFLGTVGYNSETDEPCLHLKILYIKRTKRRPCEMGGRACFTKRLTHLKQRL